MNGRLEQTVELNSSSSSGQVVVGGKQRDKQTRKTFLPLLRFYLSLSSIEATANASMLGNSATSTSTATTTSKSTPTARRQQTRPPPTAPIANQSIIKSHVNVPLDLFSARELLALLSLRLLALLPAVDVLSSLLRWQWRSKEEESQRELTCAK